MTTDENQDQRLISKGLRERMQDCQMELVDDSTPLHLHRVGASDWELPGTDFTLTYCEVNGWFVAYQGRTALFTAQTLEEAEESLQSLLSSQSAT